MEKKEKKVEPKAEKKKLTCKIVRASEYYTRVRKEYPKEPVRDIALAMLFSENKVIDKVNIKGEEAYIASI